MVRRNARRERIRSERSTAITNTSTSTSPPPTSSKSFVDKINLWIYRYNLTTALYMLEPWEKIVFNTIVFAILAYIIYGLYHSTLHPLLEKVAVSYI